MLGAAEVTVSLYLRMRTSDLYGISPECPVQRRHSSHTLRTLIMSLCSWKQVRGWNGLVYWYYEFFIISLNYYRPFTLHWTSYGGDGLYVYQQVHAIVLVILSQDDCAVRNYIFVLMTSPCMAWNIFIVKTYLKNAPLLMLRRTMPVIPHRFYPRLPCTKSILPSQSVQRHDN